MAINYPASKDDSTSLPNPTGSSTQASPDHAALHTAENAAIIALESKLGTGATTPTTNTLLLGTGTGTSAWGTVTSSQLAAAISDETGSGSIVFATTPTLTTPKIDTINENTLNNGVTVGGVNLKSGVIATSAIPTASITPNKLATGATQAFVTTQETTTSVSYTDLTTTTDSVTVTIGANGLALVSVYVGNMTNNTTTSRAYATFAISGATTQAAADSYAVYLLTSSGSVPQVGGSATHLLTGLTPGSTTFKMKYRVDAGTGSFQYRRISVVPL